MFKAVNNEFYIDKIGYVYDNCFSNGFVFPGESHYFTEIGYVDDGSIEMVSGENVFIMGAGDIIFHRPMSFHKLKCLGENQNRLINLSFMNSGVLPDGIYHGVYSLDPDERKEFKEIFGIAASFLCDFSSDLDGQEVSERLSALIIKLCKKRAQGNLSSESGAIIFRQLVNFMYNNVYRDISLTDLSEACHVSISYIKYLFSHYAGISPKSYFLHLRAKEVSILLDSGNTVAEISDIMGFSSPNYLSLFFKKQFGYTPTEYRRKIKYKYLI